MLPMICAAHLARSEAPTTATEAGCSTDFGERNSSRPLTCCGALLLSPGCSAGALAAVMVLFIAARDRERSSYGAGEGRSKAPATPRSSPRKRGPRARRRDVQVAPGFPLARE